MPSLSPLYVVTMVSNPVRFRSRYELYKKFSEYISSCGVELYTVELAFGSRPFAVTERDNPRHVQLRTYQELWHKENAINLGINYLSQQKPDWEYVAWVDADVSFARPDWAEETVHRLQHYSVVQMFSRATDLSPDYQPLATHKGFMASYVNGEWDPAQQPYQGFHPGFAWAARRDALDTLGGLFDYGILGAGDRHMATALVSEVDRSYPPGLSQGYIARLREYQFRASKLRKNVGFVPGLLLHQWHGKKANRRYLERWKILADNAYDPSTDLCRDSQGLYKLVDDMTPRHVALRDQIRAYFAARNEDDVTVS